MQALQANEDSVKSIMNQLLKGSAFDHFELRGAEIRVITKVEISGIIDKSYVGSEEQSGRNYCLWSEIKPFVFSLVKGSRKPQMIKLAFALPDDEARKIDENASSLFLNFIYEDGRLRFTIVTSQRNFSLDKSLDDKWETRVLNYFHRQGWIVSTLIQ